MIAIREMTEKELLLSVIDMREKQLAEAIRKGNDEWVDPAKEATTTLNQIWDGSYQDPLGKIWGDFYGSGMFGAPYIQPPNRGFGEDLPVQITWQMLYYIRAISRVLCATNEYATSALENRVNYSVGDGLVYEVVKRKNLRPPSDLGSFISDCQALIDIFNEQNDLPAVEEEMQMRSDIDGEAILRIFPKPDGSMPVRFVEPEWVRSPDNSNDPETSYGVVTDRYDVQTVKGYYIVEDPFNSNLPRFVDASYVLHHKQRVMLNTKRGRPIFFPVFTNLRRTEALGRSISAMAVARAKIALIRKMKNATEDAAKTMINKIKAVAASDPVTGQERNIEQFQDGSIITTSDNMSYEYPAGNIGSADFIEVFKNELRGVAAALNMPEWMLTSNASDMGAYTSSMVSEAPAHKSFKRQQRKVRQFFGDRCVSINPSLCWRYLLHCANLGLIPGRLLRYVRVKVTSPSLQTRDPYQEAQRHQIYFNMGVMTKNEIRAEMGLDPLEETTDSAPSIDNQSKPQNNV